MEDGALETRGRIELSGLTMMSQEGLEPPGGACDGVESLSAVSRHGPRECRRTFVELLIDALRCVLVEQKYFTSSAREVSVGALRRAAWASARHAEDASVLARAGTPATTSRMLAQAGK